MANPQAKAPTDCRRVYYCEQEVDAWIRAKIRGETWQPVEPQHPTIISKREMLRRVGLSFFTCWKLENEGKFPRRFHLDDVADAAE